MDYENMPIETLSKLIAFHARHKNISEMLEIRKVLAARRESSQNPEGDPTAW